MKKFLLLTMFFALFVTAPLFAMVQDVEVPEVDLTNVNVIIGILTPLITLLGTWLFKKVSSKITGVVTLVVVPVIAGLFTLVTQALTNTDMSWILQLLLGCSAVFLHQLYLYASGNATTS